MTRDEHLEWAKRRALEYVEAARYEQVATRYERVRELLLAAFTSLEVTWQNIPSCRITKALTWEWRSS